MKPAGFKLPRSAAACRNWPGPASSGQGSNLGRAIYKLSLPGRVIRFGRKSIINGLYTAEVIHRRGSWRSFEAVEFATLERVDWFNNRRLLQPIGNVLPAEAEAASYAAIEPSTIKA